jgi:hypothetical protein
MFARGLAAGVDFFDNTLPARGLDAGQGGDFRAEELGMARSGRRTGLTNLTTSEIYRELRKRERRVATIQRRRDRLSARLNAMDDTIRSLGGSVNGTVRHGGGRRPRNETNLVEALAKLLKGKSMRVKDMVGAVQRAGYKTGAANFRTIVNQALIKNKTTFKKLGRGEYTAA